MVWTGLAFSFSYSFLCLFLCSFPFWVAIQAQQCWENPGHNSSGSQGFMETSMGGGLHQSYLPTPLPSLPQALVMTHNNRITDQYMYANHQYPQVLEVGDASCNRNTNRNDVLLSPLARLEVEKQSSDIDRLLNLQNEKLKAILQEQRGKQLRRLLNRLESKTRSMIREKDEEIARASIRRTELEVHMKKVEMENEAWHRVAEEREAMVACLSNTLVQLRESHCCLSSNGVEDAQSSCGGDFQKKRAEDDGVEVEEEEGWTACKSCKRRRSCVVFLPCRHMCSCKPCNAFLEFCPVCYASKKATIEVLMS